MLKIMMLSFILFCLATEPVYTESVDCEDITSQTQGLSVQCEGTQNLDDSRDDYENDYFRNQK